MTRFLYPLFITVLAGGGIVLGIYMSFLAREMRNQLNVELPSAEQFGEWWQYSFKEKRRFSATYNSRFPSDCLMKRYRAASMIGWPFAVLMLWLVFS